MTADEPAADGRGPVEGPDGVRRCPWGSGAGVLQDYHDTEWGVPVTGEAGLFERLCLEGFQSGLSWLTVLNKRDRFREVFHGFDPDAVAAMGTTDVDRLLTDPGIIRHRGKIEATLRNARATVALRADGGLEALVERHLPDQTPRPETTAELPTTSPESVALSRALKKAGFAFVGPTTVFATMEATGLVDTHLLGCFRRGVSGRWPA